MRQIHMPQATLKMQQLRENTNSDLVFQPKTFRSIMHNMTCKASRKKICF